MSVIFEQYCRPAVNIDQPYLSKKQKIQKTNKTLQKTTNKQKQKNENHCRQRKTKARWSLFVLFVCFFVFSIQVSFTNIAHGTLGHIVERVQTERKLFCGARSPDWGAWSPGVPRVPVSPRVGFQFPVSIGTPVPVPIPVGNSVSGFPF